MADDGEVPPSPMGDVVLIPVADEAVLFDERTGTVHALDARAAMLWRCFDGTATIPEIARDVADAFEVELSQALEDVRALASVLTALGVLEAPHPRPVHTSDEDAGPAPLQNPPDP